MTLPGKIESIKDGRAVVTNGAKKVQIDLGLVLDSKPGDWVLYTANQAIQRITEAEAKEIQEMLSA